MNTDEQGPYGLNRELPGRPHAFPFVDAMIVAAIPLVIAASLASLWADIDGRRIRSTVKEALREALRAGPSIPYTAMADSSTGCDSCAVVKLEGATLTWSGGVITAVINAGARAEEVVIVLSRERDGAQWRCRTLRGERFVPSACKD